MAKPLIIENGQRFNNLTVLKEVEKSLTTPKSEINDTSCFRNG